MNLSAKYSWNKAEVLLQEPSSERLGSPIVEAVESALSVELGKKVKGIDKNDTAQLQELLANVLCVLSTMQTEN